MTTVKHIPIPNQSKEMHSIPFSDIIKQRIHRNIINIRTQVCRGAHSIWSTSCVINAYVMRSAKVVTKAKVTHTKKEEKIKPKKIRKRKCVSSLILMHNSQFTSKSQCTKYKTAEVVLNYEHRTGNNIQFRCHSTTTNEYDTILI